MSESPGGDGHRHSRRRPLSDRRTVRRRHGDAHPRARRRAAHAGTTSRCMPPAATGPIGCAGCCPSTSRHHPPLGATCRPGRHAAAGRAPQLPRRCVAPRRRPATRSCTSTLSTTCRSPAPGCCPTSVVTATLHTPPDPVAGVGPQAGRARPRTIPSMVSVSHTNAKAWRGVAIERRHPQRRRPRTLAPRAGRDGGGVVGPARPGEGTAPGDRRRPARRDADSRLVGPRHDDAYFAREVAPRLGGGVRLRRPPRGPT